MATEKLDYIAILADMRTKRSALDASIAALEAALSCGALGQGFEGIVAERSANIATSRRPMDLPAGAFNGKSLPDSIKLYLEAMQRRKTAKEIASALKEGGVVSTSDNFESVVAAALQRMKSLGVLLKFADGWGLAEWSPASFRTAATKAAKPEKKTSRKNKAAKKTGPKRGTTEASPTEPSEEAPAQAVTEKIGAQAAIEEYYAANPGVEFSTSELATALKISTGSANLVCAKLAHRGKLEKTASGRYRRSNVHAMPQAG